MATGHVLGGSASAASKARQSIAVNMLELLSQPAGMPIVPIRLVTGRYDVAFGGNTFVASGQILGVEAITESIANGVLQTARLTVSGVPAALRALALDAQYAYPGRPIALYQAWLSPTYQVLDAPDVLFAGVVNRMKLKIGGGAEGSFQIVIECASKFARLRKANERRLADEQQRALYPGDTGLRFLTKMREDTTAVWGQR